MPKRQAAIRAASRLTSPHLAKKASEALSPKTHNTRGFIVAFLLQLAGWTREGTMWVHYGVGKTTTVWYDIVEGIVSVETKEGQNANAWDFYPDNPKASYVDYNGKNMQSTIFESPERLLHRFRLCLL